MKKIQWVAVSVSFVLAVTLWLLVTLNKQRYTTAFNIPVKLVNCPENYQLLSEFPRELEVLATGSGIKLFYQSLDPMKDTVEIDFAAFRDKGYFMASKNLRLVSDALQQGLTVLSVNPDTISLAFATKSNKTVPVRLDLEWDLPPSYRVNPEDVKFTDSVLVVGPKDSLVNVVEVKTVPYKLPRSIQPQVIIIPLDSLGPMKVYPNSIKLTYTPKPYTEKVVKVPVSTTGIPLETRLNLDPDSVEVKVLLPLEKFEWLSSAVLSAEVAYSEIDRRSKFVVPQLVNVPDDIEVVSFTPRLLQYMVITQE
jgi:YbbR domain-containing protein